MPTVPSFQTATHEAEPSSNTRAPAPAASLSTHGSKSGWPLFLPRAASTDRASSEERHADRIAESFANGERAPSSLIASGTPGSAAVSDAVVGGQGDALPPQVRGEYERFFAADLSSVRVHTGADAATRARAIGARAFATGPHIVLGEAEYAPHENAGRELLAHELAHVVQPPSGGALELQRQERPETTARQWDYEIARLTTEEIETEARAAHEYLVELPESDPAYDAAAARLQALEGALVVRQRARTGFQQAVGALRQSGRAAIAGAEGPLDAAALYSQLSQNAQGLFVYGVFSGCVSEIPPGAVADHLQELQEHYLVFYGGYLYGLPGGLWDGLTGLLEGIWQIVQLGFWTSPVGMGITLLGEAAEFAGDPGGYVARRRRDYEQLRAIATALRRFGEEFGADPSVVLQSSGDLGFAVGQELAGAMTDYLRLDTFEKGHRVGNVAGQVAFEVLLEIILAIATEGVGNVIRGVAAGGQSVRAGGRLANVIRRMLEASPALRRLVRAVSRAEDAADVARAAERAEDVADVATSAARTTTPPAGPSPVGQVGSVTPEVRGPVVERGRVRPRTETGPPAAPARRVHTLDAHQQSVLDEIADDLEAHRLDWEDIGVREPDGVHGFLARYDDPYDGLAELNRRLDDRIELDPRARMEMDVEGLRQQQRPGGITRGTPEARQRIRESSIRGEIAEGRHAGELTPGRLPRTAREIFPGGIYDDLLDDLQQGRISMREFAEAFPPEGARQVEIPVPDDLRGRVTTRRVDHMVIEGDSVVLRESKDIAELAIGQGLRDQIDRDLWIARRHSGVVIEWRIDGALTQEAKDTFKLLIRENPGIFRVIPPSILD